MHGLISKFPFDGGLRNYFGTHTLKSWIDLYAFSVVHRKWWNAVEIRVIPIVQDQSRSEKTKDYSTASSKKLTWKKMWIMISQNSFQENCHVCNWKKITCVHCFEKYNEHFSIYLMTKMCNGCQLYIYIYINM